MSIALYTLILPRIEFYFLEEWIDHHLNLGIDKIFIYNNGLLAIDAVWGNAKDSWAKKPYLDYFRDYTDKDIDCKLLKLQEQYKSKIALVDWKYQENHKDKYPYSQISGFKNCVNSNAFDWWLFCDPDEFFVIKPQGTFPDLINTFPNFTSFRFSQKIFEKRSRHKSLSSLNYVKDHSLLWDNKHCPDHKPCETKCLTKSPINWSKDFANLVHRHDCNYGLQKMLTLKEAFFNHYRFDDHQLEMCKKFKLRGQNNV